MDLSWIGLKISITGARLSHLVQKDNIWDYGSMVEQVKAVFLQMEKAKKKEQPELVRKYMTIAGYEFFNKMFLSPRYTTTEKVLDKIAIIEVKPENKKLPDRFCALIRYINNPVGTTDFLNKNNITGCFTEHWLFFRQGDWWLLQEIRQAPSFFPIRNKFAHH